MKRPTMQVLQQLGRQVAGLGRPRPELQLPVAVQYAFVDVAGFSRFNVAQQLYVVETLREIIATTLRESPCAGWKHRTFQFGGDTVGVGFLGGSRIDMNLFFARQVLRAVAEHNRALPQPPPEYSIPFSVRIGTNRGDDSLVRALSGEEILAGRAFNDAQRIMSFADGGQLLLGDADYKALSAEPQYAAPGSFRLFAGRAPAQDPVYQYVAGGVAGLDTGVPAVFSPEAAAREVSRVLSAETLAVVSPEAKREAMRGLLRSTFSERAAGVESLVDAVIQLADMPRVWRDDYRLIVTVTWADRAAGRINLEARFSWNFSNFTGNRYAHRQRVHVIDSAAALTGGPVVVRPDLHFIRVNNAMVHAALVPEPDMPATSVTEVAIDIPPSTPAERPTHVEYLTTEVADFREGWRWIALMPVCEFGLEIRHPPDLVPEVLIFGLGSDPAFENPAPSQSPQGALRGYWHFHGWLLQNHGVVVNWRLRPPAGGAPPAGDLLDVPGET